MLKGKEETFSFFILMLVFYILKIELKLIKPNNSKIWGQSNRTKEVVEYDIYSHSERTSHRKVEEIKIRTI